jgi:hypothetical protein
MQITIPRKTNKCFRDTIKKTLEWLGNYLLGAKLAKNISVRVSFEQMDTTVAMTTWEDDNIRPREFNIALSYHLDCNMELIRTLSHEMIHVMQFARGDLQDTKFANIKRWLGDEILISGFASDRELPWEEEAYDLEYAVLRDFIASGYARMLLAY